MLMAILYRDEQVVAAAYACDQHPYGNQFWTDIHSVQIPHSVFEFDVEGTYQTCYVSIANLQLRERLLLASKDDSIDLIQLTEDLEKSLRPSYVPERHAA